jgi:hypothetical protein
MSQVTHIRDLRPGDRFYLLHTMQRHTYIGVRAGEWAGHRHIVRRDGEDVDRDLHHSCHVKRIVRAAA